MPILHFLRLFPLLLKSAFPQIVSFAAKFKKCVSPDCFLCRSNVHHCFQLKSAQPEAAVSQGSLNPLKRAQLTQRITACLVTVDNGPSPAGVSGSHEPQDTLWWERGKAKDRMEWAKLRVECLPALKPFRSETESETEVEMN